MRKVVLNLDYFRERSTVDPATDCWSWALYRDAEGYGYCYVARDISTSAHRLSYIVAHGSIDADMTIDHLCRNTSCVNPEHLEPVTMAENIARAPRSPATLNANKDRCAQGHKYTPENTSINNRGTRVCRICQRAASARYAARRHPKKVVA